MLIDIDEFTSTFSKKLDSFLASCPLEVLKETSLTGVTLHIYINEGGKKILKSESFTFNFDITVKENIHNIKTFLIDNYYPVLRKEIVSYLEVSASKKLELLKKGEITAEEAINYKEEKTTFEDYTLTRILMKQRLLHLLKDGILYECKLLVPLVYFRQNLLDNYEKARKMFQHEVEYIKPI